MDKVKIGQDFGRTFMIVIFTKNDFFFRSKFNFRPKISVPAELQRDIGQSLTHFTIFTNIGETHQPISFDGV